MTFYVGIDVAKNKHDLAVIDGEGEIIIKNLRFQNSSQGFELLKKSLEQLNQPTDQIQIALEDTGHYAYNLVAFLQNLTYPVFTYNPLLIKEFAKSQSLRKTKTDMKDALLIAKKLCTDLTSERYRADGKILELKELTRYQDRMIQERSKSKILYVRILDLVFPELSRIVDKLHRYYILDLLEQYPSAEKIRRAHFSSLLKINRMTAEKAMKIQEAASHTIGNSSEALQLELLQLISTIRHYNKMIDAVQEKINEIMDEIGSPILSVTGIGYRLGATIIAEIKCIDNFTSPAQLQAFAGLDPAIYQSGQMDNNGRMVKRGSHYLRYALTQAARIICQYSPTFKTYLQKKIDQGKHYNVAIGHAAKKLIRVIYYLLKTNQNFDEAKLR